MQKDNPTVFECSKSKDKLHIWLQIIKDNKEKDGAVCIYCSLVLSQIQAVDVWRE